MSGPLSRPTPRTHNANERTTPQRPTLTPKVILKLLTAERQLWLRDGEDGGDGGEGGRARSKWSRREQCRQIARLVEAAAVGVAFTLKITPLTVLTWWLTTTSWQEVRCAGEETERGREGEGKGQSKYSCRQSRCA